MEKINSTIINEESIDTRVYVGFKKSLHKLLVVSSLQYYTGERLL